MATSFRSDQTEPFTIAYHDAGGNPVSPTVGQVVLSDSDATVATVTGAAADGTAGTLTPIKVGAVSLVATRNDGVVIPLTNGDFTITAAAPATGTVTPGTPTP